MKLTECNILLVDDMSFTLEMIKDHLGKLGFTGKVFTASSIEEGIQIFQSKFSSPRERIHFIICDYYLQKQNGLDFVRKLRSHKQCKIIPFLLITTEDGQDLIVEAYEAGISTYLNKPWTLEGLKERLEFCWKKYAEDSKARR